VSCLEAEFPSGVLRAEGAGPDRELPFADRVIATLVVLRFQLPHAALAVFYGVHRCTVTRAGGEIRPLLAARGFAVPGQPGLRLATLADVFAHAAAEGVRLRVDGTEVQVRRPRAGRPGRRRSCPASNGRTPARPPRSATGKAGCCGWARSGPGRMHDITALRTEGVEDLLRRHPDVQAEVDAGYQGLARDFPGQVSAPPKKPGTDARPEKQPAGNSTARPSPPSGSGSSTPSPNPSNGDHYSATSAAAASSRKPP
jgi:Helix-turn-helix of DDE superfamily endonuclease